MQMCTKGKFVQAIYQEFKGQITKEDIKTIVNIVEDKMFRSLRDGQRIVFDGVVSFHIHERPPRIARNPQTGEKIKIGYHYTIHSRLSKTLKSHLLEKGLNVKNSPRKLSERKQAKTDGE